MFTPEHCDASYWAVIFREDFMRHLFMLSDWGIFGKVRLQISVLLLCVSVCFRFSRTFLMSAIYSVCMRCTVKVLSRKFHKWLAVVGTTHNTISGPFSDVQLSTRTGLLTAPSRTSSSAPVRPVTGQRILTNHRTVYFTNHRTVSSEQSQAKTPTHQTE
jgi:hypothetical protein